MIQISNCNVHSYNTRRKMDVHVVRRRLKLSQKCISYSGGLYYNKLPDGLKVLTLNAFKIQLKKLLLNNPFYSFQEFFDNNIL